MALQNERVTLSLRNGDLQLLESSLSDGSIVYAIRVTDWDDNTAILECISEYDATKLIDAIKTHSQ